MKRRKFLHQSAKASAAVSLFGALACKGNEKKETSDGSPDSGAMAATAEADLFFDLSLGQQGASQAVMRLHVFTALTERFSKQINGRGEVTLS